MTRKREHERTSEPQALDHVLAPQELRAKTMASACQLTGSWLTGVTTMKSLAPV